MSSAAELYPVVIRSYRHLLRSAKTLFRRDPPYYQAACVQAKALYRASADVTDPETIKHMIAESNDAAEYMFRDLARLDYNDERGVHGTSHDHQIECYSNIGCL